MGSLLFVNFLTIFCLFFFNIFNIIFHFSEWLVKFLTLPLPLSYFADDSSQREDGRCMWYIIVRSSWGTYDLVKMYLYLWCFSRNYVIQKGNIALSSLSFSLSPSLSLSLSLSIYHSVSLYSSFSLSLSLSLSLSPYLLGANYARVWERSGSLVCGSHHVPTAVRQAPLWRRRP